MVVDALLFDVFGTVVDWRASIVREVRAFAARMAIDPSPPSVSNGKNHATVQRSFRALPRREPSTRG
jgi:FMN phosphatase YigB (HAD superfamily)